MARTSALTELLALMAELTAFVNKRGKNRPTLGEALEHALALPPGNMAYPHRALADLIEQGGRAITQLREVARDPDDPDSEEAPTKASAQLNLLLHKLRQVNIYSLAAEITGLPLGEIQAQETYVRARGPEVVSEETLDLVRRALADIRSDIVKDDAIEDRFREQLTLRIHDIERAIDLYRIRGSEGVAGAVGDFMATAIVVSPHLSTSAETRLWKWVGRAAMIATILSGSPDAKQLLDGGMKLLLPGGE